jgi:hypothetical protein
MKKDTLKFIFLSYAIYPAIRSIILWTGNLLPTEVKLLQVLYNHIE